MKKLNWNEEYAIKFELNGHKFSSPVGKGFTCRFEVDDEIKRLKAKGVTNISIYVRKWN